MVFNKLWAPALYGAFPTRNPTTIAAASGAAPGFSVGNGGCAFIVLSQGRMYDLQIGPGARRRRGARMA
jgi:hypothetical protein